MRIITAGMLVALVGLAVAAPVPKTPPNLEDVFGEITDKKSECKFEMNKDGALTVTVPTTHPSREPDRDATAPPMVGKTVTGDFVLTVRVTATLPKPTEVKGAPLRPAVTTGVSIVPTNIPNSGSVIGLVRRLKNGGWNVSDFLCSWEPWPGGTGPAVSINDVEAKARLGDPTWFRVTRRERLVEMETSSNGTSWKAFTSAKTKQWGDTVSVGPVAFGCIDQEFSVTFDQYEIKPLKEEKK